MKKYSSQIFTKSSSQSFKIELSHKILKASKIFVFHLQFSQTIKFFNSKLSIYFSEKFLKFTNFKDFIIIISLCLQQLSDLQLLFG